LGGFGWNVPGIWDGKASKMRWESPGDGNGNEPRFWEEF